MKWYKYNEKKPKEQTFAILYISSELDGQPVDFRYNEMVYKFYKLGRYHDGCWRDPYLSLLNTLSNLENIFNIKGWCEISLFSEDKRILEEDKRILEKDRIKDRFEILDL